MTLGMYQMSQNKACFLDRDGVIIEEVNYLSSPDQVKVFPEAIEALKLLRDNNYKIIIVTNQAGVARGYFKLTDISLVHDKIDEILSRHNLSIDSYYYCPHHPKGSVPEYSIECNCRKPMPGMLLEAIDDHNINISKSFLIGDKMSDINAGKNVNCPGILVKTGHGSEYVKEATINNIIIKDNILEAVEFMVRAKN